jgi:hypothetical protein
MIRNKNVLLRFVMGRLIQSLNPDKDQWEPDITPKHAQAEDHIPSFNPPSETGQYYKREDQQHNCHKKNNCIDIVQEMQ